MKLNLIIAAFVAILSFIFVGPAGILSAVLFWGIGTLAGIVIRYIIKGIAAIGKAIKRTTARHNPVPTATVISEPNPVEAAHKEADQLRMEVEYREKVIASAQKEAAEIIAAANAERDRIIQEAQADANRLQTAFGGPSPIRIFGDPNPEDAANEIRSLGSDFGNLDLANA